MAVEARVNPTWAMKWTIMAIFLLGYGGLCVYDGLVGYPNQIKIALKAREYKTIDKDNKWVFREGGGLEWSDYAKSQGWSTADPGEPHSDADINTQWYQLAICAAGGFAALFLVLTTSRRKLVADEQGVTGATGPMVPYSAVTSIDKARWDSKGIAMVLWTQDGKSGKLKIDDWVFRDGDRVLEEVERHTGLGTISTEG